jgi:hypothetical protein
VASATAGLVVLAAAPGALAAPLAGPSSTVVTLSTVQSAYGQVVTATAAVTTNGEPPQGDVVFSVDGTAIKANLGGAGTASAVLPRLLVGTHPVSATFVPQFPASQQGSTAPTQDWVVVQVRTRLQVRVIGKGVRIPTSVQVKAAGEYGTLPTGRVRLELRRIRSGDVVRAARRLSSTGVALADLGRLRKGAYRLVVTYGGDVQHLTERQFTRFRVQQR